MNRQNPSHTKFHNIVWFKVKQTFQWSVLHGIKISIYMKEKNKHKNLDNSSAQSGIEEKGHFQQINYSNIQFTLQQKISN